MSPLETNPIRVCEILVGLPDVDVLGVEDEAGEPIRVKVETRGPRPSCSGCGGWAQVKGRDDVVLIDLLGPWSTGSSVMASYPMRTLRFIPKLGLVGEREILSTLRHSPTSPTL